MPTYRPAFFASGGRLVTPGRHVRCVKGVFDVWKALLRLGGVLNSNYEMLLDNNYETLRFFGRRVGGPWTLDDHWPLKCARGPIIG